MLPALPGGRLTCEMPGSRRGFADRDVGKDTPADGKAKRSVSALELRASKLERVAPPSRPESCPVVVPVGWVKAAEAEARQAEQTFVTEVDIEDELAITAAPDRRSSLEPELASWQSQHAILTQCQRRDQRRAELQGYLTEIRQRRSGEGEEQDALVEFPDTYSKLVDTMMYARSSGQGDLPEFQLRSMLLEPAREDPESKLRDGMVRISKLDRLLAKREREQHRIRQRIVEQEQRQEQQAQASTAPAGRLRRRGVQRPPPPQQQQQESRGRRRAAGESDTRSIASLSRASTSTSSARRSVRSGTTSRATARDLADASAANILDSVPLSHRLTREERERVAKLISEPLLEDTEQGHTTLWLAGPEGERLLEVDRRLAEIGSAGAGGNLGDAQAIAYYGKTTAIPRPPSAASSVITGEDSEDGHDAAGKRAASTRPRAPKRRPLAVHAWSSRPKSGASARHARPDVVREQREHRELQQRMRSVTKRLADLYREAAASTTSIDPDVPVRLDRAQLDHLLEAAQAELQGRRQPKHQQQQGGGGGGGEGARDGSGTIAGASTLIHGNRAG